MSERHSAALTYVTGMANRLGFTLSFLPESDLYRIYEMGIDPANSSEPPVAAFRRLVEVNAFLKGVQHVIRDIESNEKGGFGFGA